MNWRERTLANLEQLTIEKLRVLLGWEVVEEQHFISDKMRFFFLRPSNSEWPSIDIGFDEDLKYVQHVGFSHWHAHFHNFSDERLNILRSIRRARQIVRGQVVLCEEFDARGRRGGYFVKPGTPMKFNWEDSVRLISMRFNEAPKEEAQRPFIVLP